MDCLLRLNRRVESKENCCGDNMNIDEYSAQVVQLILSNIEPRKGYLTAASLGERLSRANLEGSWKDFRFKSFLHFLEELQQRRLIRLIQTDKKAWAVAQFDGSEQPASALQKSYNPLRKAVWAAFVFSSPGGRRFMHRYNGSVRLGLTASPSPVDEWAEIEQINDDTQKKWAVEFLAQNEITLPTAAEVLSNEDWHRVFPSALIEHASHKLKILWNRCRTLKVATYVEEWGAKNSVPVTLIFTTREQEDIPTLVPASENYEIPDHEIRQCILTALSSLPTEQLLKIQLPTSALLDAARIHLKLSRDQP